MNLLTIENIYKSYVDKILFDNISFGINEGQKIGLIGINGTGKSTLLKIIVGIGTADSGEVIKGNSINIEYLPQNPEFDNESTVLEEVFRADSKVMKLIRTYELALNNKNTSDKEMLGLIKQMDECNAWNVETEAKAVLTRLGIENFKAKISTLSGGQKKRIALARALVTPSDLLVLDEPTNHLDNETIDWLEQYLNQRKGAVFMVTHDRYFLDRVSNEILELEKGKIYTYEGNYSKFLEKKLEREEILQSNEKKRQSLYKKELAWIKKGAKARTTKQKARIQRFEEIKNKEVDLSKDNVEISVGSSRLGKKVIDMEHIYQKFDDSYVIDDFSYIVDRNDRIGIVGANGIGKSTLMNIIYGKIKPTSGIIEIGDTVKIGFYGQENYGMDENLRIIEYIRDAAEIITTAEGKKITASQMLEKFLFSPEKQWALISKISGGEKRRLYLLRILMECPNVLLLDEPTNDLDIETLKILEEYIEEFNGAVITVSHDRYFLDRIAEKIFYFEGNGKITIHIGNYSEFKEKNIIKEKSENIKKKKKEEVKDDYKQKKNKQLKLSYKEQREYESIDDDIANLEENINEIEKKIGLAVSDYTKLQELLEEKENLKNNLEEKMDRWIYLNELVAEIESNKTN